MSYTNKSNLHNLKPDDLDNFQIDDDHNLYWNGHRLKTELKLTKLQNIWAIIVTVAAILASLATIASSVSSYVKKESSYDVQLQISKDKAEGNISPVDG